MPQSSALIAEDDNRKPRSPPPAYDERTSTPPPAYNQKTQDYGACSPAQVRLLPFQVEYPYPDNSHVERGVGKINRGGINSRECDVLMAAIAFMWCICLLFWLLYCESKDQ